MGTVYAIANQKGGVGKTTTAVNLGACVAEAGYRTLLVDLDPQCNATVALGVGKDAQPNVYDCLTDGAALDPAVRATSVERLYLVPSSPELAGANVELPLLAGSEQRLSESMRSVRRQLLPDAARLPAVARAAHGERAGRGGQGDRPGADGVLRARGARRPARHAGPHPARAQPQVECCGDDPDDARRAHAARAGRRARGAGALPRARLRDRHPAQRPHRGSAQPRRARSPSTTRCARDRWRT